MSLILEALKKSEAERRLGRAPGLLDPAPAARSRGGWRAWHLLLGLAVLVAVAMLAYRGGQRGAESEDSAAQPAPAPDASTVVDAPLPPMPNEARPPQAPPPQPEATAPSRAQPPAAADPALPQPSIAAPPPQAPADPGFASIERESLPQAAQALPKPSAMPTQAPAISQPEAHVPASSAETGATTPAASPSGSAAAVPAEDSIPLLSSLGPEARGQLPPLKVSMHVFAQTPADRVLILDGRRLREGDQIDPRLRLLEIRSDGSVIELDGRRLLLPRP